MNENEIHFAVMAIGATAKKMRMKPWNLKERLEAVDLMGGYVEEYYDVLHTQSIEYVADSVKDAVTNWEAKRGMIWRRCTTAVCV